MVVQLDSSANEQGQIVIAKRDHDLMAMLSGKSPVVPCQRAGVPWHVFLDGA
jgi:hypothetical protein